MGKVKKKRVVKLLSLFLCLTRNRRFDKLRKQRVRGKRAGEELGVELGAEEKRMRLSRKLGDLHQNAVGRGAGKNHAAFFYVSDVLRIYLVAMAVALVNQLIAVSC